MDTDALASARAVRQPVLSTGDAKEAFDGLTYDKGAAVLRMIEGWLGPDTFRRGVQRYLKTYAWKSARAEDLFQALDYVSSQKIDEFAAGFLDHPGVPEVTARLVCSAGRSTLELRQSQWRPLGEPGGPAAAWTLPVCAATDARKARACFTLGAEPIARELGPGCPSWVFPNSDQAGYYRFVLDRAQLVALSRAARSMDPIARLGLVSNGWAAVRAGAIEPSALLDVLPMLDGEENRLVIAEIVGVLRGIDDALVDEVSRGAFRKYVAARFGSAKRALGWEARAAPRGAPEDDEKIMRRQIVLSAMGDVAHDDATLSEADVYARKWISDPASVPGDVAAVAVPLASTRQGARRLEELRDALRRMSAPQDRAIALRAMGAFEDPEILSQAFDFALTADVKLSEMRHVFGAAVDHRAARPALYAWEKSHWNKLKERLPGSFGQGPFLGVAGTLCTPQEREDARAFLTDATRGVDGLRRSLDGALEASGLCIALREHGAADVGRYFARGGAGVRASLR
jgi:alanyl aminopeptidase